VNIAVWVLCEPTAGCVEVGGPPLILHNTTVDIA